MVSSSLLRLVSLLVTADIVRRPGRRVRASSPNELNVRRRNEPGEIWPSRSWGIGRTNSDKGGVFTSSKRCEYYKRGVRGVYDDGDKIALACAGDNPIRLTMLCLRLRTGEEELLPNECSGTTSVARLRRLRLPTLGVSPGLAVLVPASTSSSTWPRSSPSLRSSRLFGAHAMMNTPAKVAPQPYKNVTI